MENGNNYSVALTRTDDGKTFMTCPMHPEFTEDYTLNKHATIVVRPTQIPMDDPYCTMHSDQDANWQLVSTTGRVIKEGKLIKNESQTISIPTAAAHYFLIFQTNDGYRKYVKLSVPK